MGMFSVLLYHDNTWGCLLLSNESSLPFEKYSFQAKFVNIQGIVFNC